MTVVKVRRGASGTGKIVTSVTIPKDIADDLEAAGVTSFSVEATEDGILLRPFDPTASSASRPTWLRPPQVPSDARRATRTDAERAATA